MARLLWKYKLMAVLVILGAIVVASIAVMEWFHSGMSLTGPAAAWNSNFERLQFYFSMILVGCASLAYDMRERGPTVTLRHGVFGAVVCWTLIVPFGTLSKYAMVAISFGTVLSAVVVLCVFVNACMHARVKWLAVLSVLAFWLCTPWLGLVSRTFGAAIFIFGVLLLVRSILNLFSDPISSWLGVVEIKANTDEFRELASEFATANSYQQDKYPMYLEIKSAYRLDRRSRETNAQATWHKLVRSDKGRRLYHGTPRPSAQAIVSHGFRLPTKAGMFGKGIYFADCPLKSWQYTDGRSVFRPGIVLCCWVELGRSSPQGSASVSLTAPPRRSFWEWIKGESKFQSVTGLAKENGGSLRVPEYIIYDPAYVEVDYILEVSSIPKAVLTDDRREGKPRVRGKQLRVADPKLHADKACEIDRGARRSRIYGEQTGADVKRPEPNSRGDERMSMGTKRPRLNSESVKSE
eukprot:TRINITY_DN8945_c0_g1_i4.p1 TRINITY_DN8945_c0_g1~~TRINITY_DN8945_c0_g1_i4.p1  ORF type:complete len:465 (-),score=38.28 TRINITY_DN8945_c0_g1_i4:532-1926(-)